MPGFEYVYLSFYYTARHASKSSIISSFLNVRSINDVRSITFSHKKDDQKPSSIERRYNQLNGYLPENDNAISPQVSGSFTDNFPHQNINDNNMGHCTSPVGSMDGSILVESESGEFSDFTTLQVSHHPYFFIIKQFLFP